MATLDENTPSETPSTRVRIKHWVQDRETETLEHLGYILGIISLMLFISFAYLPPIYYQTTNTILQPAILGIYFIFSTIWVLYVYVCLKTLFPIQIHIKSQFNRNRLTIIKVFLVLIVGNILGGLFLTIIGYIPNPHPDPITIGTYFLGALLVNRFHELLGLGFSKVVQAWARKEEPLYL